MGVRRMLSGWSVRLWGERKAMMPTISLNIIFRCASYCRENEDSHLLSPRLRRVPRDYGKKV
jgi:hypothetical protein